MKDYELKLMTLILKQTKDIGVSLILLAQKTEADIVTQTMDLVSRDKTSKYLVTVRAEKIQ